MMALVVMFQRTSDEKEKKWEIGIAVSIGNEPAIVDVIIDNKGKPVPEGEIWDFKPILYEGCFVTKLL